MAQHQSHHDGHRMPSLHNLLKMLLSSNTPDLQGDQETGLLEEADEPPDGHILPPGAVSVHPSDNPIYVKSQRVPCKRRESLLTRALLKTPDSIPLTADREARRLSLHDALPSYPHSNASGHSTAELTSDGDLTSPPRSNTPSPPLPSQFPAVEPVIVNPRSIPMDPCESLVEANLGRKRCISFACPRQRAENGSSETQSDKLDPPKRRPAITFACPTRESEAIPPSTAGKASVRSRARGSPAPSAILRTQSTQDVGSRIRDANQPQAPPSDKKPGGIHMSGLGGFKPSEETRFHEFASSMDEDDEWVNESSEFKEPITLYDCLKKENAIRKLGEEAETEAMEEEEQEGEDDADEDGVEGDDSTVHDFSSDDGNESDNEAGFADSDESDDDSEYGFWAPVAPIAGARNENLDLTRQAIGRRNSNTSIESFKYDESQKWLPAPARRGKGHRRPPKRSKRNAITPDLPDSTDFVCGTLDEDRPLEVAYLSCLKERRESKHIPIPQDIDPSFPATDPEDNDDVLDEVDEEDEDEDDLASGTRQQPGQHDEELIRGRSTAQPRKTSPRISPKRVHSPGPRLFGHSPKRLSPKRLKSPAPPMKLRPNLPAALMLPAHPEGVNITGLVQRPYCSRTKSLPRTPNPFFIGLEKAHQSSRMSSQVQSPDRGISRSREMHTRGAIDIIQGLEKKRQKRKEKFWRQHCRKAAKEQMERRPVPGKGAERMKELGLEVAERFRAYGIVQDVQLMLSV